VPRISSSARSVASTGRVGLPFCGSKGYDWIRRVAVSKAPSPWNCAFFQRHCVCVLGGGGRVFWKSPLLSPVSRTQLVILAHRARQMEFPYFTHHSRSLCFGIGVLITNAPGSAREGGMEMVRGKRSTADLNLSNSVDSDQNRPSCSLFFVSSKLSITRPSGSRERILTRSLFVQQAEHWAWFSPKCGNIMTVHGDKSPIPGENLLCPHPNFVSKHDLVNN